MSGWPWIIWQRVRCVFGRHDWFDAMGWLSHDDQYCGRCFASRDGKP